MIDETEQHPATRKLVLRAPLSGQLVPIERVPDPVFSQKMVGDGIAVDPISQSLLAPCDGEVVMLHPANHALTLATPEGIEDPGKVNQGRLKALGAAGVVVVGSNMQAIFGPKSEGYKIDMDEYLKVAGPEAELSETELIATAATALQPETVKLRDPAAADKALSFIQGLGGAKNIKKVEAVAETRLRVVVGNERQVNDTALQAAGVNGIMRLPNRILHLIVGPNADQYAAEMAGQLA